MIRIFLMISILCVLPVRSQAQDFGDIVKKMIEANPEYLASEYDYYASEQRSDAKFRDRWAPKLNLNYKYGKQYYQLAGSESHDEFVREFDARLEQKLTDFGESNADVSADEYSVKQKEANLEAVRQKLTMEAIDVFLQIQNAQALNKFAQQSYENIQEQTKLESMLVEKGKGYSSNVLQAKTQLAGAKARLNRVEADLDVAMARGEELFREALSGLNFSQQFDLSAIELPQTLDETISLSIKNNPRVEVGAYRSKTLEQRISYEKGKNFYPDLALVGQLQRNYDLDGHVGTDRDDKIMLEFRFPLNLGLSGFQHTKAARHEMNSSKELEKKTIREIERNAKIAWRNFQTASDNKILLENKVNIASEFLRLAQEERRAGRRSLLEVLSAETTLINSQGELSAAITDQIRSAFSLLYVTGGLDSVDLDSAVRN